VFFEIHVGSYPGQEHPNFGIVAETMFVYINGGRVDWCDFVAPHTTCVVVMLGPLDLFAG